MNPILRFVAIFIFSYALIAYTADHAPINALVQKVFKNTVAFCAASTLPEAYIETQGVNDKSGDRDNNVFYLVYGNPKTIKIEQEEALRQGLKEYRISTYAVQLFTFQLFTVPMAFLLALFIASPMMPRIKLSNFIISALLLNVIILIKLMMLIAFSISNQSIGIYSFSNDTMQNLSRMLSMMSLGFSIMFGFILWLIFGFRKSSLAELINGFWQQLEKNPKQN